MIDVTMALAGARAHLETLFVADGIRNLLLEEVILSDDGLDVINFNHLRGQNWR